MSSISPKYKSALAITGLVTFIAAYHYIRIFNSWVEAYEHKSVAACEAYMKANMLGVFSGLMIIFGYPGEMIMPGSPNINMRWLFWGVSMIPFLFVVYTLTIGTKEALDKEEDPDIKSKINSARIMTIVSWLTYPVVYILPMFGLKGAEAIVGVQMGYTVSDIISKCGVGLLIYKVTLAKSEAEGYSTQVDEKH